MDTAFSVPGRKGVYTTDEAKLSEADIEKEALRPGAATDDDHKWDDDIPF